VDLTGEPFMTSLKSDRTTSRHRPTDEVHGLSLRRGFGWNFLGNATYNLAQWVLLVILARVTDKSVVGQFSLTLAISAPIFLTVGLNMRTLQATDASRLWGMREYLSLRHLLNVVALVVTVTVGFGVGLRGEGLAVVAVVALSKCVEAVSQTYYGYFQKHERLDLVARSLLLRSVTGPLLFWLGIVFMGDLVYGCVGLLAGWMLPQWLGDRPSARELSALTGTSLGRGERTDWRQVRLMARRGVPLGVDAGLSSLAINVPRYAVLSVLGAASLGTFAALAYVAQTIQMITSSMSGALIARLAIYYHQGRRQDFVRLLVRLTGFGIAVMVVAIGGALVLGGPFLRVTLGQEYADQGLLVALLVGAGLITLQRGLCTGLEASWRFKTYVVVDAVTTGTIAVLAPILVQEWGLVGAAAALAGGFALGTVVVVAAMVTVVRAMPMDPLATHTPGFGVKQIHSPETRAPLLRDL
jgi:O-antigen/teichoic acid export membrane protein